MRGCQHLLRLTIAGMLMAGLAAGGALARDKKTRSKGAKQDSAAIESAQTLMASGDRDQVEAGIQSLGLLGSASAVKPLSERIAQGLPPDLLETAIVTLMALSHPDAGPTLHRLTAHRRPTIRLRAVEALSAIAPSDAQAALIAALSDSDPKVRSAAATGLGEIGAKGALPTLFHALDRGNLEASFAIGKLVKAGEVQRLLGYLGKVPFHSLGPALGEVLKRADINEASKLEVVARLQELGTPEVKGFLGDLLATTDQGMPKRVARAMLQAMQEIADR